MPLVAHTTGRPPGRWAAKASRPRLRDRARPSARCSMAMSSDRPGSPLSRAMVVPSGRSRAPNPMWYCRSSVVMARRRGGGEVVRGRRRRGAASVEGDDAVAGVDLQLGAAELEEDLAAAAARGQVAAVGADHRRARPGARRPSAASAWATPHSAHSDRPYDAFSTLQPVTTRPSSTSAAAPTRTWEYGA